MTESPHSTPAQAVLTAGAVARLGLRRAPATSAGLLTAIAIGATWLLVPSDDATTADALVASVPARPAAAASVLSHPVQPVTTAPVAARSVQYARDPFRPLLTPPDQSTSAPAGSPSGSTPDSGAPSFPDVVVIPDAAPPPRAPSIPETDVPTGSSASISRKKLELTKVEVTGETFVAVLAIDGEKTRAKVGESFGPGGQLLLLSLQQGPRASQWTAVVQAGRGEPFDVVSGTPTRIP